MWLYPLIYSLKYNLSLDLPSSTRKTLVHYATKFGLIKRTKEGLLLTEKAEEMLKEYVPLNENIKRLKVKGQDGCFLIIVRRKKGVKVVRVPC